VGFVWHRAARVFDGQGARIWPAAFGPPAVIVERPSGAALARAFGAGVFRIGGDGPPPEEGFQTLTAGSSGAPRRVARSHASWARSFAVNAGLFGIGPGVQVAVLGRLVQSLSLYGAVEAVGLGADLHLLDDLRPAAQVAALAERRVAVLYAAPVHLRLLAEAGGVVPDLRLVVVGGAKLDAGLRAGLSDLGPRARICEFYGAAETSFITLAYADCPPGSVGRAYPGVILAVVGGEIRVRSPYLFTGYAGAPGPAVWHGDWLSVGEMGRLEDGCLYLSGRAGRMVTVAGQNVFPEAIEAFLAGLPGVRQVAVLPRPDPLRGAVLVAVVQGDAGVEAALLEAARGRFGAMAAPRAVVWRTDWPVLPSGKTDLRALTRDSGGGGWPPS